jgi:hypothetical protein
MDKKSKILLWIIIFGAIISLFLTAYNTLVKENYTVTNISEKID